MIEFSCREESGIVYVNFSGEVSLKEIEDYLDDFAKRREQTNELLILYDMRESYLEMKLDDVSTVLQMAEESTKLYEKVKSAYVVDNPQVAVFTTLFSAKADSGKTKRKVFSTKEAAVNWLEL